MKLGTVWLLLLASALAVAGCRLYLWAGDHEVTIPAVASPTPEPSPTASATY